jgi:hypothetical protein
MCFNIKCVLKTLFFSIKILNLVIIMKFKLEILLSLLSIIYLSSCAPQETPYNWYKRAIIEEVISEEIVTEPIKTKANFSSINWHYREGEFSYLKRGVYLVSIPGKGKKKDEQKTIDLEKILGPTQIFSTTYGDAPPFFEGKVEGKNLPLGLIKGKLIYLSGSQLKYNRIILPKDSYTAAEVRRWTNYDVNKLEGNFVTDSFVTSSRKGNTIVYLLPGFIFQTPHDDITMVTFPFQPEGKDYLVNISLKGGNVENRLAIGLLTYSKENEIPLMIGLNPDQNPRLTKYVLPANRLRLVMGKD